MCVCVRVCVACVRSFAHLWFTLSPSKKKKILHAFLIIALTLEVRAANGVCTYLRESFEVRKACESNFCPQRVQKKRIIRKKGESVIVE